jgi:hypothetical protein
MGSKYQTFRQHFSSLRLIVSCNNPSVCQVTNECVEMLVWSEILLGLLLSHKQIKIPHQKDFQAAPFPLNYANFEKMKYPTELQGSTNKRRPYFLEMEDDLHFLQLEDDKIHV